MTKPTEVAADQVARALANREGIDWALLHPSERDQWRGSCARLIASLDESAFAETIAADSRRIRLALSR